jgi:predicted PurR-regulated permease PerM
VPGVSDTGRDMAVWTRRGIAATVGVLAVVTIAWLGSRAVGVLVIVFVAILLADGLQPVVTAMRARLPVGLGTSILLVYGAFLAAVVVAVVAVVPAALTQLDRFSLEMPASLERARAWAESLRPDVLASSLVAVVDAASRALAPAATPRADQVVAVGMTIGEAVASVATVLTLVFFWLTEHARLQRYVLAFLAPGRRAGAREAWDDVEGRLGLWVRGQLILMVSMAAATGILYSVVGLPSALLLGLIAGIAEAIPMVGPILGAIPALVVAASVGPEMVVVVAIAYVVIQFLEGNVLVPMVMKNTIRISSFMVVASLLVGAAVAGILGALLAVPVVAAAEVILERFQDRDAPVSQVPATAEPDGPDATSAIGRIVREVGRLSVPGAGR